jgi:MSHA biogenesis protein MshN
MSIINKMLQDLEQRHADNQESGTASSQLRAAPFRNTSYNAWILSALLAVALIGLLMWLWLRPAVIVRQQTQPQLALKATVGLSEASILSVPEVTELAASSVVPAASEPMAPVAAQVQNPERNSRMESNVPATLTEAIAPTANVPAMKIASPKKPANEIALADKAKTPQKTELAAVTEAPVTLNKQVRELTPQQHAENDYRRAVGLAQQGRSPEAIALLEQALQGDPQNASARQTLIALLLGGKRQDEAARRAQEGLALDARQSGFAMILARLQVEKGEQKTAIATLQRTLPYAADKPEYQAFLAALLQRENRHKDAIDQYLSALNKAPQNGVWWMGLGISLQAENRLPEAREAFTRARESATLSPDLQAFVEQKLKQLPH